MQKKWAPETHRNVICIDSYSDCVPSGRLRSCLQEERSFSSLSQLLLGLEAVLNEANTPQAYTAIRRFSQVEDPLPLHDTPSPHHRGKLATFDLTVIFRQNSSWQGSLRWRETGLEQHFRSVLELVQLMDSALRSPDEAEKIIS